MLKDGNDDKMVLRKLFATLDMKRKSMDHDAESIYMELTMPPSGGVEPMGIDTPMVNKDGYTTHKVMWMSTVPRHCEDNSGCYRPITR